MSTTSLLGVPQPGSSIHTTTDYSSAGAHDASSTGNMQGGGSGRAAAPQNGGGAGRGEGADGKGRGRKNIVLCFDGSGNAYNAKANTNVVKLMEVLDKDSTDQVVYYQAGVNKLALWIGARLDFAIAINLPLHINDGYQYLMNTYQPGDRIFLFGFSRGAYTARALAGMLEKVGLLGAGNEEQVAFAYNVYQKSHNSEEAAGFKRTFCRYVKVHFVGVWDTVQSVGVFYGRTLPFATADNHIRYFRQALSLDERRARFKATYWTKDPSEDPSPHVNIDVEDQDHVTHPVHGKGEEDFDHTDVKELWFAGSHCDVGGGYDDEPSSSGYKINPANVPLRWMIREAVQHGLLLRLPLLSHTLNMKFDRTILALDPLKQPDTNLLDLFKAYGEVDSERLRERESPDVASGVHGTLAKGSVWWLAEYFPIRVTTYGRDGKPENKWVLNKGAPRDVPDGAKLHTSVKIRMDRDGYKPLPQLPPQYSFVD